MSRVDAIALRRDELLDGVRRFVAGGEFAVFLLSLVAFYELLLIWLMTVPPAPSGLGAFAESFRVWCLGFDSATGRSDWPYLLAMTAPQALLAGAVALVWWQPLRELRRRPSAAARQVAAAGLLVGIAAGGLVWVAKPEATGELPFPAEALRTEHRPPQLALINQAREPVELAALRGNVVLLTAVYASCPHTCPLLLTQAKAAIAELPREQRSDLRVVAVSLDPSRDVPEVLAELARMQGLETPLYHLVTGDPDQVEQVLDEMGVARERNASSGVIDHASLFILIDRGGQVAYRIGLGDRQGRWLTAALRVLLDEPRDAG